MRKRLILTVGFPRSGKSTWARKQAYPIVSPDAIRLAIHGQAFCAEAEPMVWNMAHYMVESLFRAGHETVILDATNITEKRRQEWKSDQWETVLHLVETPANVCIQRAIDGNRHDLVEVIERMASEYDFSVGPNSFPVIGITKDNETWSLS